MLDFPDHGGKRLNTGGARPGAGRPKGTTKQALATMDEFRDRHNNAVLEIREAKAKRESFLAHMAELDFMVKAGQLVSADEVERASYQQGRILQRNLIELMPARIAKDMAEITDIAEAERYLQEQIRAELANVITAFSEAYDEPTG